MTKTTASNRILIIEDDEDIADLVNIYLQNHHYATQIVSSLKKASTVLEESPPDLVVCDILLPDGLGTAWVERMKPHLRMPVIFLSSRQETEDIIRGLELGDDYITKPFDPDILVARVKARLRNVIADPGKRNVWTDGSLELHFDRMEVRLHGTEVALPAKELQLLFLMASRPGHVFSVEQLFERIWGLDNWSDARTVMVHIHHLRRKIEAEPSKPRYIVTVRGIGYRFQA